ncbi:MAG: chemotaxis protein CheA, partial [Candidatus Natronoplasma sp.]
MSEKFQEMFEEETKEQIEKMNEDLLLLEKDPSDLELIEEIYRASHTLKGMAGTMGYEGIQKISHRMEELFDDIKNEEDKVDERLFELLFECVDMIEILATGEEEDYQYLIDELDEVISDNDSDEKTKMDRTEDGQVKKNELPEKIKEALQRLSEKELTLGLIKISEDEKLPAVRGVELRQKLDFKYELFWPDPEDVDSDNNEFFVITEKKLDKRDLDRTTGLTIEIRRDKGKNLLKGKEDSKNEETKKRKITTSDKLKVNLEDIEHVMNLISELVISKGSLEDISSSLDSDRLSSVTNRVDRISSELRESVLDLKMTEVRSVFRRFPRMVRDIAKEKDKKVDFEMIGEDIELDRTILDRITDPLVHLLRNAVDHGIEPIEERKEKGKPPKGKIRLSASQKEENVVIEVSDDGRGLDKEKIKKKAVERGSIDEEEVNEIPEEDLYMFVFNSHFSTKDEVTEISGRGVGMGVVKETMDSLGGEVSISSEKGEGTTIKLTLPPSVAIVQAFLIRVGEGTYAISLEDLVETAQVKTEDIEKIKGKDFINLRDKYLPLIYLREKFEDVPPESIKKEKEKLTVSIVSKEGETAGFVIDEVITEKEVVIKPLPKNLQNMGGFMGATILGDGTIAMILD